MQILLQSNVKFNVQVPQTLIIPGDGRDVGIKEPQELKGLMLTRRGTVRSYGALNCSMYFLCNSCQEELINACCCKISRGLYKTINVSLLVVSKCLCDIIKISKYKCLGFFCQDYMELKCSQATDVLKFYLLQILQC